MAAWEWPAAQLADFGVPPAGARGQVRLHRVRVRVRVGGLRFLVLWLVLACGGGGQAAAAVRGGGLGGPLAQVVPQVPAVGDLDRAGGALAGAFGVGAGPVPADHRGPGMSLQPALQGGGLPVREQVDDLPGGHVDQDGAVDVALAQREVVDAQGLGGGGRPGSGIAMSSRIIVCPLGAAMPSAAASRDPARPHSAAATAARYAVSGGVRRAYREVRPPTCPANVTAGQAGSRHRNRIAASQITTSRPPAWTSRSRRWYREWTRPDSPPHRGHAASSAPAGTARTTRPPCSSALTMTVPDRCGSSTPASGPGTHDTHEQHCDNDTAGSWWLEWPRHPPGYQEPAPGSCRHAANPSPAPGNPPERYITPRKTRTVTITRFGPEPVFAIMAIRRAA